MKKVISIEGVAAVVFGCVFFLWWLNTGNEIAWKIVSFFASLGAGALVYKLLEAYNRAMPICAIGGVFTVWIAMTMFEVI